MGAKVCPTGNAHDAGGGFACAAGCVSTKRIAASRRGKGPRGEPAEVVDLPLQVRLLGWAKAQVRDAGILREARRRFTGEDFGPARECASGLQGGRMSIYVGRFPCGCVAAVVFDDYLEEIGRMVCDG